MSSPETDIFSLKFKNFIENNFKQKLNQLSLSQLDLRNNFRRRIIISLLIITSLIIIIILCKTKFHVFYDNLFTGYKNLEDKYYNWYINENRVTKFFLPSYLFFLKFPSPFRFLIFSIIILPIWCIFTLFNDIFKNENLFEKFLRFYDENLEILFYQKLLYSNIINDNIILNNYENVNLQDNIILNIDNFLLYIAQIRASSFLNLADNKLSFIKNIVKYRGIILSSKIEKKENRLVKIFIGDIDKLDFTPLNSLQETKFIGQNNYNIRIFASNIEEIIYWKKAQELEKFFHIIQEYIYLKPVYYDKFFKNLFNDNFRDDQIELNKILEITISEEDMTMIITSGRNILHKESVFDDDLGINDCYLIANIIKIFKQLLKKLPNSVNSLNNN